MLLFQSQTGVIHPRLQANNPGLSSRKSWKSMKDSYATSRHTMPHPSTKTINKRHLHQLATTRGIGSTPDPLLRRLQGISRTADLEHIWSHFGTAVNLTAWSWKDLNWISAPHVSTCKFGPPKFKHIQNRTTWSLVFDCQFTSNPNLSGRTWCFIRDTESEPE